MFDCFCFPFKCCKSCVFPGLTSKSFQGFHNLREIQCSGESLPPDSDLMTMVLYAADSTGILAAANLRKQECSTSKSYVACRIDATDTRKSKLKVLVDDLVEGEWRVYGCNVSAFVSGSRVQLYSWSITVYRISKFIRSLFNRRRGMFNHVYFMYFLLSHRQC